MSRPSPFRRLTAAIEAVAAAGLGVARVELETDGKIVIGWLRTATGWPISKMIKSFAERLKAKIRDDLDEMEFEAFLAGKLTPVEFRASAAPAARITRILNYKRVR